MTSVVEYVTQEHSKEDIESYHENAYDHFKKHDDHNFMVSYAPHAHENLESLPLKGLVVTVKDCFTTKDLKTTAGSKILDNYVPVFDATIVERIKSSGGFIIGKTSMDEFGFGSFSTNYYHGPVRNALNKEYVAGGSSGGSAVATAISTFPHVSIAESTGGSISNPAAFNGVFSITPTYGLLSRYGLIDYASSLDKPGLMGKSIEDIALILDFIAGKDEKDPTTIEKPVESFKEVLKKENPLEYKVAYIDNYVSLCSDEIKKAFYSVIDFLNSQNIVVEKVSLPYVEETLAAYYVVASSECSTNLAKYCGMRYGMEGEVEGKDYDDYFSEIRSKYLGKESKRRILLGTFARMSGYRDAYYLRALKVRTLVIEAFKELFKKYDVLLAPTMPILPIKIKDVENLAVHEIYSMDVLTVGVNLASLPHVNVPIKTTTSFPAGLHVIADHLNEHKSLSFSHYLENAYKGVWRG